jgi:hypothetical protein
MKKLFAVLLIAFLVVVVYLRIGRAAQQLVAPAAVEIRESPTVFGLQSTSGDPIAALEGDIARMRAAVAADNERYQAQIQSIRDKYAKAQKEADVYRQMVTDREQEAAVVGAERQAGLADLERRLEKIRQAAPRKPGKKTPAGDSEFRIGVVVDKPVGIEAKLDLILQRLDSMEKRLQKLEGKPGQPAPDEKP